MIVRALLVVIVLSSASLLAGCVTPGDLRAQCDAEHLVTGGVRFLDGMAKRDGGIPANVGGEAEARLTAWVLIAAALTRRAGYEGEFDARPHTPWLQEALPRMFQEGTGVDSVANNVSLARAALQTWGERHVVIPEDPQHPGVTTLAAAWDARYNESAGRYGERLNEHLFAAFAARLFESNAARLVAMAAALADEEAWTLGAGHDPYEGDVWFAAYARALLGPQPADDALALRLDAMIEARQDASGGVSSIAAASGPDASSTAAALLAWGESGATLADARVERAVGFLCSIVRENGSVPFRPDLQILAVKTTAEVVIALALLIEPIIWPEDPGAA